MGHNTCKWMSYGVRIHSGSYKCMHVTPCLFPSFKEHMLGCVGLDSTSAMHLLHLLRQLSQSGRAVITTIHQPSSRLFQQLDKLLLLSKVYPGRALLTLMLSVFLSVQPACDSELRLLAVTVLSDGCQGSNSNVLTFNVMLCHEAAVVCASVRACACACACARAFVHSCVCVCLSGVHACAHV